MTIVETVYDSKANAWQRMSLHEQVEAVYEMAMKIWFPGAALDEYDRDEDDRIYNEVAEVCRANRQTPPPAAEEEKTGLNKREHWQIQLTNLAADLQRVARYTPERPTAEGKRGIVEVLTYVRDRLLTLTHESGTL